MLLTWLIKKIKSGIKSGKNNLVCLFYYTIFLKGSCSPKKYLIFIKKNKAAINVYILSALNNDLQL